MKTMKANFVVMFTPWLMLWHSGRLIGRKRVVSSHVVKAGSCSKDIFPKSKHIKCILQGKNSRVHNNY